MSGLIKNVSLQCHSWIFFNVTATTPYCFFLRMYMKGQHIKEGIDGIKEVINSHYSKNSISPVRSN